MATVITTSRTGGRTPSFLGAARSSDMQRNLLTPSMSYLNTLLRDTFACTGGSQDRLLHPDDHLDKSGHLEICKTHPAPHHAVLEPTV